MISKTVYARLHIELHDKVREHADVTGQSISSSVEDLVQRGLGQLSSEGLSETLRNDLAELKESEQSLKTENAALEGKLEACRTKESIALAAREHVPQLRQEAEVQQGQIQELRRYLSTEVAVCRNCNGRLRLFDLGQRRCSYCRALNPNLLPEYTAPATTWESIRDGVAVVGAAAIVAGLLNALGDGQKRG